MIAAIFAVDEEGGMGKDGSMPWPLNKEDMRWFKNKTEHQIVVMGRKTWDSPDMPSPLPKRINAVVSSNPPRKAHVGINGDVCELICDLECITPDRDIYIIGGASILQQTKSVIERVFLTRIEGTHGCDTFIDVTTFLNGFTLVEVHDLGTCKVEEYER